MNTPHSVLLYSGLLTYGLFLGFLAYVAAKTSWHRMKIGIKVLIVPAFLLFGLLDVLFNATIGSALFLDIPRDLTFSERCSRHLFDGNWRGRIAGAFAVALNAIDEDHIK